MRVKHSLRRSLLNARSDSTVNPGVMYSVVTKPFCRTQTIVSRRWLTYWIENKGFTHIASFIDGNVTYLYLPPKADSKYLAQLIDIVTTE